MTRKITFCIVLILFLLLDYEFFFGNTTFIRQKVASVSELESANKQLKTKATQLEKLSTDDFDSQKEKLQKTIEEYKSKKSEYEEIVEQYTAQEDAKNAAEALIKLEENDIKDIYDVDFLWTIVGNYATEEGIGLKFDINRNTSLLSSTNNVNNNYVVCDLKFTITGSYINLTDFIYDLEDDDRLTFEINNFDMQKDGEDLRVTLTVKEVKVNSNNLIGADTVSNTASQATGSTAQSVQSVNSSTSTTNPVDKITSSVPNTTSSTGSTSDIQAAMQDAAAASN